MGHQINLIYTLPIINSRTHLIWYESLTDVKTIPYNICLTFGLYRPPSIDLALVRSNEHWARIRILTNLDNSITIPARQVANTVLSPIDFDGIPPLQQPRDRWVPNYLAPSHRTGSEIAPWSVSRIAMVCVRTMNIELLFHYYYKPRIFLFPHHYHRRAPPTRT